MSNQLSVPGQYQRIVRARLDVPPPAGETRTLMGRCIGEIVLIGSVIEADNLPAEVAEITMPVIGEQYGGVNAYIVERDPVASALHTLSAGRGDKLLRYIASDEGIGLDPNALLLVPKTRAAYVSLLEE